MADKAKQIILVVNGYGCHLNTPLGWVYLPRVTRFIKENWPLVLGVIFTGGFTQRKSAPGVSEAALMEEYVRGQLMLQDRPANWFLEEDAYTSYENSQKSALIIQNKIGPIGQYRIVNFCEATRALKVIMLARHFMGYLVPERLIDITTETASWEQANPMKEVRNILYDWVAINFPFLGLAERARKIRLRRAEQI